MAKVSPFAPKELPRLPAIDGVRFAACAAGIRYPGRTDLLLALLEPGTTVAGVLTRSKTASAPVERQASTICAELDRMNSERQEIEAAVRDSATRQISGDERLLILAGDGWHRGVLGLAAGRIAQQWHRPTLAIAIDGDRSVSQQSVRGLAVALGLAPDTVARGLQRLGSAGLIRHEAERDTTGRFARSLYVLTLPPDVFDLAHPRQPSRDASPTAAGRSATGVHHASLSATSSLTTTTEIGPS